MSCTPASEAELLIQPFGNLFSDVMRSHGAVVYIGPEEAGKKEPAANQSSSSNQEQVLAAGGDLPGKVCAVAVESNTVLPCGLE